MKRAYVAPEVRNLGDIHGLTRGDLAGNTTDGLMIRRGESHVFGPGREFAS